MTKICAHRGFSHNYPENSLKAFSKAIEAEADSIEIDVRQTKDGYLVACHDYNLMRLMGKPERLSDLTLKEFQRLKINDLEHPVTLDEIFAELGQKTEIVLDIKEPLLEKKLLQLIYDHSLEDKVILSSFFPKILAMIKNHNEDIRTALIAGPLSILPLAINICFYLRRVSEYTRSDYMHLCYMNVLYPGYKTLTKWGYKISYWTVNRVRDIREVLSLEPEQIITNRPDLAKILLKRKIARENRK